MLYTSAAFTPWRGLFFSSFPSFFRLVPNERLLNSTAPSSTFVGGCEVEVTASFPPCTQTPPAVVKSRDNLSLLWCGIVSSSVFLGSEKPVARPSGCLPLEKYVVSSSVGILGAFRFFSCFTSAPEDKKEDKEDALQGRRKSCSSSSIDSLFELLFTSNEEDLLVWSVVLLARRWLSLVVLGILFDSFLGDGKREEPDGVPVGPIFGMDVVYTFSSHEGFEGEPLIEMFFLQNAVEFYIL